jgi:hypothetical protein
VVGRHCHCDVVSLPSASMSATSPPLASPTNAHSRATHSCGRTRHGSSRARRSTIRARSAAVDTKPVTRGRLSDARRGRPSGALTVPKLEGARSNEL